MTEQSVIQRESEGHVRVARLRAGKGGGWGGGGGGGGNVRNSLIISTMLEQM